MKKYLAIIFLIPLLQINAQWDFSASMGLDFKYASSYRDYINSNFPSANKLKSFNSSINFTGEAGYRTSQFFQLGFEYSLVIDSYSTLIGAGGIYDISYLMHRPSIVSYYVLAGEGYKFKFGGGLGLRFVSLKEDIFTEAKYNATGIGFLLKSEANTLLGENLFVLLGLDLRYDLPGDLSSDGNKRILNFANGENVNLNTISIGIKVGITYML
ncbi:MAG: hypothetical protein RDU14_14650 [Melioribacteraceae bacterium]|nr:hypothetical protein [Melioribacteraceae bacterium]